MSAAKVCLVLLVACDSGSRAKQHDTTPPPLAANQDDARPPPSSIANDAGITASDPQALAHLYPHASGPNAPRVKPTTLATNRTCPTSAPSPGTHCTPGPPVPGTVPFGSECHYPGGYCECNEEARIGGALPPDDERVYLWMCTPWAPAIWPDGCPNARLAVGDACSGTMTCAYGDEYDADVFACTDGAWAERPQIHRVRPPPPPLPR
jgi:hypothetical protein